MKKILSDALKKEESSKLPNNGKDISRDLTSHKIRNIINNICSNKDIFYLEIGLYRGGTFSAALHQNQIKAIGIDNWSQNWENDQSSSKEAFFARIDGIKDGNEVKILENDCWQVDLEQIKIFLNNKKINVYLFDGPHDIDDQYNALKYYYDILDDEFIFLVDDYSEDSSKWVVDATQKSIKDLKLKKVMEVALPNKSGYHEGFYACVLKKGDV